MNSSNNTTDAGLAPTPPAPNYMLIYWYLYVIIGAPLLLLNGVCFYVMIKRKTARLGSLFFVGLSLSDLVGCWSFLLVGIVRLYYTLRDEQNLLTTRLSCLSKYLVMWIFGNELMAVMLVASNIDR